MLDFYRVCQMYYPEFYSEDDVAIFVQCNKITPEQYQHITGVPYQQLKEVE
ncbi:XkdX family protein [Bacillus cereus]|nr:XkdX family protein [Bacillus cereus]PGU65817.1 XkdX family protein [Bacillus cereus]